MAQMVLPQTPAPGTQKDPGPSKPGNSRDPADRKNDFESVSQAEQKRLDRQKGDRKDNAKSAEEPRSDQSKTSETKADPNAKASEKADAVAGNERQQSIESGAVKEVSEPEPTAPEPTALPLTFAELQAWLSPQTGRSSEAAPSAVVLQTGASSPAGGPGKVMADSGLFTGTMPSAPGQTAQASASSASATADATLTDAIKASILTDTGKNPDSALQLGSGRFQSAMDLMSQQVANGTNSAAKLAAETAAPLRGYATSIDVPVGHAEWGDKLVGKLSWLTARKMSVAEIHLTPPDMGPMEVKVRVQNEQANITVHSANPVVRDQLELHSHRLRDMLGEQGLSLAGFDVSDSPRQQTGEQGAGESDGSGGEPTSLVASDQDDEGVNSGNLDLSWKGEVDIFA